MTTAIRSVNPSTMATPGGHYSHAVAAGGLVFVSGQLPIAPDGTTRDLVVRNAQPLRTFDQSAVDAVRRWRFEPVKRDGVPVAQRAAVRIRFELK